MDFTGPQMLLTQSVSALAFQVHDGRRLARGEQLEEKFLRDKALKEVPSLFEFMSFVYYFPAFLAGPSHHFRDYAALCDGSLFPNNQIPAGGKRHTLVALAKAFAFAPSFYLTSVYPVTYLSDPDIQNHGFVWIMAYLMFAFAVFRGRYYFAWFLSEVALLRGATCDVCALTRGWQVAFVATGEAYNGVDKNGDSRWDRVTNCDVLSVELATNIRYTLSFRGCPSPSLTCLRSITSNWNISTATWLRCPALFFRSRFCRCVAFH